MLKNRIKKLEEKLNSSHTNVVVVFSDRNGSLITKVNGAPINKLYENIDEITDYYKNSDCFIVNVSSFAGLDTGLLRDNLETIVLKKETEIDYDTFMEAVKNKAKMLENLS